MDFVNSELDVECDGLEHADIGSANRFLADFRCTVLRHEHTVIGIKRHDGVGV